LSITKQNDQTINTKDIEKVKKRNGADLSGAVFDFINMFNQWQQRTEGMDLHIKQIKGSSVSKIIVE
jgi:poly(A) polymerase Pap1